MSGEDDLNTNAAENCRYLQSMLSSALPIFADLFLIDSRGKRSLDKEAIGDCCLFFYKVTQRPRDRGSNTWGTMMYFFLVYQAMIGCSCEMFEKIIDFCVKSMTVASLEVTQYNTNLDKLVISIHRVMKTYASSPLNPEDKCIFWHNFRNVNQGGREFVAIRLEAVCNVINNVLKIHIEPSLIQSEINSNEHFFHGHAMFYDNQKHPWPIVGPQLSATGQYMAQVPVKEEDVDPEHVKSMPCVYIDKAYFEKIFIDIETPSKQVDYKKIKIKSNYYEETYNFYEKVVSGNWFGFRVIENTPFAPFVYTNQMSAGQGGVFDLDPEVVKLQDEYFDDYGSVGLAQTIAEMYEPRALWEFYSSQLSPDYDRKDLPPAYRYPPFKFRNDEEDDLYEHCAPVCTPGTPQRPRSNSVPITPNSRESYREVNSTDESEDEEDGFGGGAAAANHFVTLDNEDFATAGAEDVLRSFHAAEETSLMRDLVNALDDAPEEM